MLNALDLGVFAIQSLNVTDVSRALEQLDEIHGRIARAEVYRGWRSLPVALSGVAGILAAWMQPAADSAGQVIEPRVWVIYWLSTAIVSFAIGCAHLIWLYFRETSTAEKRRTREVLTQFLPSLAAAALLTAGLMRFDTTHAGLLPGVWAACFSLGILSARPFLPMGATLVAIYYALAAVALLWSPHGLDATSGWRVGGVFAAGQFGAAAVLYWSLERGNGAFARLKSGKSISRSDE